MDTIKAGQKHRILQVSSLTILLFGVFSLGIVVGYLLPGEQSPKYTRIPSTRLTITQSKSPIVSEYKNDELKISFKIPEDFKVTESKVDTIYGEKYTITITHEDSTFVLESYLEGGSNTGLFDGSEVTLKMSDNSVIYRIQGQNDKNSYLYAQDATIQGEKEIFSGLISINNNVSFLNELKVKNSNKEELELFDSLVQSIKTL